MSAARAPWPRILPMALAMLAILLFLSEPVQSTGLEGPFSRLGFAPCAPCSVAPGRNGAAATCGRTASIRTAPMAPRMLGSLHTSLSFAGVVPAGGPTGPWLWGRGSAAAGVALAAAVSPVIEPVEDEFDYRSADLMGTRLFVTGLPATVDDVRLYLAFESFGRLLEAHVAKPGLGYVLFEETETADAALAAMEGATVSGKAIRVKRARSFYILKEQEARASLAQAQREREERTQALIAEQARRVRALEEAEFASRSTASERSGRSRGALREHLREADIREMRRRVAQDMRREGFMRDHPLPATAVDASHRPMPGGGLQRPTDAVSTIVQRLRPRMTDGEVRAHAQHAGLGEAEAQTMVSQTLLATTLSSQPPVPVEEVPLPAETLPGPQVSPLPAVVSIPLVTESLTDHMAETRQGAGQSGMASVEQEERIRKQAMIEIMKEGDKMSKSTLRDMDPRSIDMASLIQERVKQIRRYEVLCENRELLGGITFTSVGSKNEEDEEDVGEDAGANVATAAAPAVQKVKGRGPGRPRLKDQAASRSQSQETEKRPVGRPRKHPLKAAAQAGTAVEADVRLKQALGGEKRAQVGRPPGPAAGASAGGAAGEPKRKRGRPPSKNPKVYVPTGRSRGRPRKVQPEELV